MTTRMQQYLSMESHDTDEVRETEVDIEVDGVKIEVEIPDVQDVSEDEVHEAVADLDDAHRDQLAFEQFLVDQEELLDEADTRAASLEHITDVLQHGIENEHYSPQFAAAVQHSLEQLSDLFGEERPAASLEDYGHDDLGGFYRVALEDLTEKLYKIGHLPDRILAGIFNSLVNAAISEKRSSRAKNLRTRADALLNALAKAGGNGSAEVSLKGMGKSLGVKGSVPSDLMGTIKKDQQATALLLEKYLAAGFDYTQALNQGSREAVKKIREKDQDGATAIAEGLAKKAMPEDSIPAGIQDGSVLLGNVKVEVPAVQGGEDAAGKLKAMAKRSTVKFTTVDGGSGDAGTAKLSASDLKAILNAVKTYAGLIEKANGTASSRAKGIKSEPYLDARYVKNEGDFFIKLFRKNQAVQNMGLLARKYPNTFASVAGGAFGHAVDSSQALLKLAERGIKAMGKESKNDDA